MLLWLVCTGHHRSQKGADKHSTFYCVVLLSNTNVYDVLFLIRIVTIITEQYYIQFAPNPVI